MHSNAISDNKNVATLKINLKNNKLLMFIHLFLYIGTCSWRLNGKKWAIKLLPYSYIKDRAVNQQGEALCLSLPCLRIHLLMDYLLGYLALICCMLPFKNKASTEHLEIPRIPQPFIWNQTSRILETDRGLPSSHHLC